MPRPLACVVILAAVALTALALPPSIAAQTIGSGSSAVGAPAPASGSAQRPGAPARDNPPGPRTGTARVRGRVTVAETGQPVRRAQVQLISPATGGPRTTTTDADGYYEITGLPAGTYSVSATKAGFISTQFGQRRPGEPSAPLVLADGQLKTKVDLAFRRGGVIVVRVTDEFGDPLAGAQVQVQRYQYGPNGRQLTFAANGGISQTDDLGQTRVYGLAPGEYVVSAVIRNFNISGGPGADDRSDGYPNTFFPGTANPAEAQAVIVEAGQEASAQFSLIAARLARISGRVVDSQGRPAAGAQLNLLSPSGGGVSSLGGGQVAPDGTFTLLRVPPGEHIIRVQPRMQIMVASGSSGGTISFASDSFSGGIVGGTVGGTVGGVAGSAISGVAAGTADDVESGSLSLTVTGDDISGLTISTGRSGVIRGRLVFEGTSAKPPAGQARVSIQPTDPANPIGFPGNANANGQVGADGTFELRAVAGTVLFRAFGATYNLKSVSLRGVDITDQPLELSGFDDTDGLRVVMTDRLTEITGTVVDDRGQPAAGYALVVLPADGRQGPAAQRFVRVVRMPATGLINLRGMPPGSYNVAAFSWLEQGAEWDPRMRERLRTEGQRLSLAEGQKVTLSLRLADDPQR